MPLTSIAMLSPMLVAPSNSSWIFPTTDPSVAMLFTLLNVIAQNRDRPTWPLPGVPSGLKFSPGVDRSIEIGGCVLCDRDRSAQSLVLLNGVLYSRNNIKRRNIWWF